MEPTAWPASELDSSLEYGQVGTTGLDRLGVLLEWRLDNPLFLRVRPPEGQAFEIDSESKDGAVILEGVAFVNLMRSPYARLRAPAGELEIKGRPEGLELIVTTIWQGEIAPFKLSRPPIEQWCHSLGDAWLTREVESRIRSIDEPWDVTCAAGMVATRAELQEVPRTTTAAEALAARRALLDAIEAARAWARGWSDEELTTVRDLALVAVEQLELRLRDLAETVDPGGPQSDAWMADFIQFCHLRDDLNGVLVLITMNRHDRFVTEAVTPVDRRAERFVQILDPEPPVDDERVRRTWLGQPDAWWGWPAALEDDDESRDAEPD